MWILHRTSDFNLSIKTVVIIATNELKVCLSMYIISSSNFLLQNIDQCFNYRIYTLAFIQFIHLTLFKTTDQFPNFMTLTYYIYNKAI